MKQTILFILFSILFFDIKAEGIQFFEGTWEEAQELAIKNDQIIFVDAYTAWCGPCKKMAKDIFTQKSVGDYYNQNFINVKLDMEKGEGPTFARKYQVRSYPTLLFIDGGGEIVHRAVGGKPVDAFIQLGQMVMRKNDKSEDFQKLYDEGKRDPDFIYNYVKALNRAEKPSLKVANDYIKTQDDMSTDFNLKFLFEAVTEADSRIFDLMIKHKKKIIKKFGQDEFNQKVIAVTNKTINKAIEYESTALLDEAKEKINVISDKDRAKLFHLRADKKYYLLTGDTKNYLKASSKYVKDIAGKDAEKMNLLALETMKYLPTDKKALAKAEEWAGMAYKLDKNKNTINTYANILYENGNSEKALKVAQKGLEIPDPRTQMQFKQLIQKIELSLSN